MRNSKASFYTWISLAAALVSFVSIILFNKDKRNAMKEFVDELTIRLKLRGKKHFPLNEAAGYEGDIENVDMVSEGSSFGVEYYNKVKK